MTRQRYTFVVEGGGLVPQGLRLAPLLMKLEARLADSGYRGYSDLVVADDSKSVDVVVDGLGVEIVRPIMKEFNYIQKL